MEGLRERSYRRSGALARAAFTVLLVACSGLLAQESEPGNAGDVIKRMRETGKVNQGASPWSAKPASTEFSANCSRPS